MAMVVPDGILTNSSLQYVRDAVEEWFRIVAVVSMPQTAFSATGAGVKSSVLFLKKYSSEESENIKRLKLKLQGDLITKQKYVKQVKAFEDEKKQKIKELTSAQETKVDLINQYKAEKESIDLNDFYIPEFDHKLIDVD